MKTPPAALVLPLLFCTISTAQTSNSLQAFSWSGIPAIVISGQPFSASLEARSSVNTIDTNFNGVVAISEVSPIPTTSVLITEIQTIGTNRVEISNLSAESQDLSGWKIYLYDYYSWPNPKTPFTIPAGTLCPPSSVFELRDSSGNGSYPVFYTTLPIIWPNASDDQIAAVITDAQDRPVDFFCAGDAYPVEIWSPATVTGGFWSGPPVSIVPNANPVMSYRRRGRLNHHNAADWSLGTNSFGSLNPELELPFITPYTNSAASPALVTLVNGNWSGELAIGIPGTNVFVRADAGQGISGDSAPITMLSSPPLFLHVPQTASKDNAGPVGQGRVSIVRPLTTNLMMSLSSSLTNQIQVPVQITINAGSTNAVFEVTNLDDGLLEGPQAVVISATALGFASAASWITNYDRRGASVFISAPPIVGENVGWILGGRVSAGQPVATNVLVYLSSDNTNKLLVPDSVLIHGGQNTAAFGFSTIYDPTIDGDHLVTVTATVPGWASGQTAILVIDAEITNSSLSLPSPVTAGAGTLTNVGTVQLGGILTTDLQVTLTCNFTSKLQVPLTVTVPAGQSSAQFDVTVPPDTLQDGDQGVTVTASAPGFGESTFVVTIIDNEVSSFSFSSLAPSVMVAGSFPVTIAALNKSGTVVPGYERTVSLSASAIAGNVSVVPSVLGPFTNGVWAGLVSVEGDGHSAILSVNDGSGHTGSSNPFDVVPGRVWRYPLSDFVYDALRQQILAAVVGSSTSNGQSVVALDPETGKVAGQILLGSNPGKMAISADDQFLYLGLTTTGGVARVDLTHNAVDLWFGGAGTVPYDLAVPPGDPHALVAWIANNQGMALYRDGVKSSAVIGPTIFNDYPYEIIFADSPTNFYNFSGGHTIWGCNLAADGPHFVRGLGYLGGSLVYEGGLLFSTTGDVYEPRNLQRLGAYPTNGLVAASAQLGQVYFLSGTTLHVFDLSTFLELGEVVLPGEAGTALKILSCGTNGVAISTPSELMLIRSQLFSAPAVANVVLNQTSEVGPAVTGSNFTYSVTLSNAGPVAATNVVLEDVLPVDTTVVLVTNLQGVCTESNGMLKCFVGTLAAGASLTTRITVQPATPGPVVNSAWVLGQAGPNALSRLTNTVVFGPQLPALTRLWFNAGSLAYDASRNALWGTVSHFDGALETGIRSLDVATGLPKNFVPLDYPAQRIALSANDRFAYASYITRTDFNYPTDFYGLYVHRIDLSAGAVNLTFSVTDVLNQQENVTDMIGILSYPNDVLISGSGANTDVTLYENGVAIRRTTNEVGGGRLANNPTIPTRAYLFNGALLRLNIDSNLISTLPGSDSIAANEQIRFGSGLLFSDLGTVADPEGLTNVASLPVTGQVVVDSSVGLAFYLVRDGNEWTLTAFDLGSVQVKWSYPLMGVVGNVINFVGLQPGLLAFNTDADQVFILNTAQLPHLLQADLQLTQTASLTAATTNVPVTFTTMVVNAGPAPAVNVLLTNQLPMDALVSAISSSQGGVTNVSNDIVCTVGDLQVGQAAWLQFTVTLDHAGTLTNMAGVAQAVPDPVLTNNFAVGTVDFSTIPVSDLVVSQSTMPGSLVPGSNIIQTVTISNAGPSTATGVQLTDYVFAGATIVSATADQGTMSLPGPVTLQLNLDALTNSAQATVTMVLSPSGGAVILNGASAGATTFDPNLLNNQSIAAQMFSVTNGQGLMNQLPVLASDIVYDAVRQRIIASTIDGQWPFTNGLLGITLSNNSPALVAPVQNRLGQVALSDDGHYAYVAIMDTGGVARVDLLSQSEDLRFAINTPTAEFGPFVVEDFAIMPGTPTTLAVARGGYSGYSSAVALFDNGVQRPDVISNDSPNASNFRVGFADAGNLYTTQPDGFQSAAVTLTGLTNEGGLLPGYAGAFVIDHGLVFLQNGTVLDPTNGASVASFPVTGAVWPDLANRRVYFMTDQNTVRAFDWNTGLELWSVPNGT
jgi:uncharacterized repeat protein (TIGR01451 family)